jgi:hypothetical protein
MFRNDRLAALRGFAVLLAVALLLGLLAAACDGDDNGETPPADETPAAGETPAADGDDGDGDGDGDGASDEGIQELASLAAEASEGIVAKITYRIMSEAAGETMEGEWVLVQRPPDSRIEIAGEQGGEEFRTIIINAGGKTYLCADAGGEQSCLTTDIEATETQTALLDPLFDIPEELAEDAEDVDLIDKSERQIAGIDATCFTVSGALSGLGEGEGEVCFSDDGLLLYLGGETGGETFIFEATEVSTDVTDDDFEPPYDVVDLSDLEGLEDLQ